MFSNIGEHQQIRGNLSLARANLERGLALFQGLVAADPSNAGWQRDLSISQERIGEVLQAQGDLSGALRAYQVSLAIGDRLAQQDPSNAGWQRDV